ncbi:response regulator transcription factor [Acidovorax sp. FG27]
MLVVDDHPRIREPLAAFLRREGLEVHTAGDARASLALLQWHRFDAVVLDVMLPDADGSLLCPRLQAEYGVPVLLLTARSAIDDRVRGLEQGADDYVTKPFDPRELLARIRAVVRRRQQPARAVRPATGAAGRQAPPCFAFAGWRFDAARGCLRPPAGPPRQLAHAEARLLEVLLHHANTVLSRDQLLDLTRTQGRQGDAAFDRTIDRQISRLRVRLRDAQAEGGPLLRTVRGGGYALMAPVERVDPAGGMEPAAHEDAPDA